MYSAKKSLQSIKAFYNRKCPGDIKFIDIDHMSVEKITIFWYFRMPKPWQEMPATKVLKSGLPNKSKIL